MKHPSFKKGDLFFPKKQDELKEFIILISDARVGGGAPWWRDDFEYEVLSFPLKIKHIWGENTIKTIWKLPKI